MGMEMQRYKHIEAAKAECAKYGAILACEVTSKNIHGRVTVNGKSKAIFFSKTPSDYNVESRVRRHIRHTIAEILNIPFSQLQELK